MIAQQSYFYKIDSENGFQSNEVYEITQDSFGFIWIGCDAGIFRYDGVSFKQYIHPEQNGRSISHLIIDKKQRVWCQNFAGQIFYIYQDSIHLFKDFSKESISFPKFTIFENKLFASIGEKINIYNTNTKKLEKTYSNKINKQAEYFELAYLTATENGLYGTGRENIFFRADNELPKIIFKNNEYFFPKIETIDNQFITIGENQTTKVWTFFILENDKIKYSKPLEKNTFPKEIYMISKIKDKIAVCTSRGVYIFDADFNLVRHYFPNERITDALYDREGNLWLTSLQNGIYVIPSLDLKIYSSDFFPDANITTLAVQNENIITATYLSNVYEFNPKTENFKTLNLPKDKRFRTSKRIIGNDKYQIFALGALTVLKEKTSDDYQIISNTNLRDMVLVEDSLFWVSTYGFGVNTLKAPIYKTILHIDGRAITNHPNKKNIYFSNKNGFSEYKNGKINEIKKDNQSVFPMCLDWQGDTLWLGTLSDGIMAYHNGRFVKHLYKSNGNPNNMVRSIRIYKNWLLAATDLGLIRMDLRTEKMEIVNRSDGLHQNEIRRIEVLNDDVFLATTVGMIRFPLNIQAENPIVPNIALHAIFVNDSTKVDFSKQKFKHTENNILFQFQTALFRSRKNFHYEYRLKGLSDRWQKTDAAAPLAQYRSLPAGKYVFEVRAVNEDGVKSRIERFEFSVAAPIWFRWWFILLTSLIITFLTYWFVNRRIRRIQRQARIENELRTSQLTALKAQMNPHFLYNALNSIQDLILQKDVKNAVRYLTKFSHLMRQILDASGMTSISLSDEIKILTLYLDLEKLRFGDNFQYTIEVKNDIDVDFAQIPPMIIQPFVENAVKHGLLHKTKGTKNLTLHFEKEDLLICTIIDNGVGRAKAAQIQARQGKNQTSFATSATQKRLEILNETYQQKIGLEIIDLIENNEAKGTKVVLRVPIKNHS